MSDPTIRLSTCRQDGRCPECDDECPESLARHPCGCSWCYSRGCNDAHTRALLTEALRQRQMDREFLGFPGEDGVKPARAEYAPEMDTMETLAYVETCAAAWEPRVRLLGNAQAGDIVAACLAVKALLEERDAAIREHQRALGEAAEIAQGLQSKLDEAIRERDLARTHDAQPYPTAEAYERVCAALEATKRERDEARERAQELTACMAWMKSPVESCLDGRADGDGGCGACSLCCKEQKERAEKAERERDEARANRDSIHARFVDMTGAGLQLLNRATVAEERADRAEALLRDASRWIELEVVCGASISTREKASALLAKIREVLG